MQALFCLRGSAAANNIDQYGNDSDNQECVNEAPGAITKIADKPSDHKDHSNDVQDISHKIGGKNG